MSIKFSECKAQISADLLRVSNGGIFSGIKSLFFNHSFQITFWFRLGSYLKRKNGFHSKILYGIVFLIHKKNMYKTGIQLPIGTDVGEGLVFPHFSCIVINSDCTIGKNCKIFQGVTIGSKRGENGGCPTIGNNVVISSGAKVIGKIAIGDNVMIGANSVITKDIPDDSVAAGNPAQIINQNGKYHTAIYFNN